MAQRILVATTNPGKLKELSGMLSDAEGDIVWQSLAHFPDVPEVEEDGSTFVENARKKALGYAQATGLWTIADDSGLIIDALNGRPGVFSARYSEDVPPGTDRKQVDIANYKKVLSEMEAVPEEKRTGRFMCHLCLASPEEILLEADGAVEGVILRAPAGCNGFGYDPIFYIPSLNKTAAQLDNDEKNMISHRGCAIREFKPLLKSLLRRFNY